MAAALSSQGSGGEWKARPGLRSQTTTTRGPSSAYRSRTTKSSCPRADDTRADAAQSIERISSPRRYGRLPATSEPRPRRTLRIVPNVIPIRRRRGMRGKVGWPPLTSSSTLGGAPALVDEDGVLVGARPRRELQALRAELLDRRRPPGGARARDERGREHDPVHEHRDEQPLDVLRHDVA